MPNCFMLTRKGEEQMTPLQQVDDEMRTHFGAPPSATEWYRGWYDTIGFGLAMGNDWDRLRELYEDAKPVIDWLEANFTVDAWWQGR